MSNYIVTGSAGFIGFHLCMRLLSDGHSVVGIDNLNDYYDVSIKMSRLNILKTQDQFRFYKLSLENYEDLISIFEKNSFDAVINLAAQAGVRYSLENPKAYIDSNLVGFANVLEACRYYKIGHLVYASSSSVYGSNAKVPFSVHDNVDHPLSLYAATKKSNELMAHVYSHLFSIPTTGLRFFTAYGPWGRPDMALFIFTKSILEGKPIKVFNNGDMLRDFTYIDDIIEGIVRIIPKSPSFAPYWDYTNPDPGTSFAPYRVYNIGNSSPIKLTQFIEIIEDRLKKKAERHYMPIQPGDVPVTYADVIDLMKETEFRPVISIKEGVNKFIDWYMEYYGYNK